MLKPCSGRIPAYRVYQNMLLRARVIPIRGAKLPLRAIALTYGSIFLAALCLLCWHTLFTSHAPCLSLRRPCCVTRSCTLLFTLLLCMSTSRHLWLCHVQPLCSILVFSYGPSFKVVLCSCPWQCPLGNIEFIIVSCLPQGLYSPPQPCTSGVALAVFGALSHVKLALWLELRRLSPCRV